MEYQNKVIPLLGKLTLAVGTSMEMLGLPLGSRKQPCPRHLYVFTLEDPLHPSQLSCAKADSTTLTPQIRETGSLLVGRGQWTALARQLSVSFA